MSVVDTTAAGQTATVTFELELPHRPAKVWRALTEPQLMSEWLLPSVGFALEPGADFMLRAQPQPGWDGTVQCRVVEVEERRKLSYTWVVGDIDTVVTFTLEPSGSGTRLSMVQTGFREDQKRNFGGARYGWRMMTDKLVEVLARVPAEPAPSS